MAKYRITRALDSSMSTRSDYKYWIDCPNGLSFMVIIDDKRRRRLVTTLTRLANKALKGGSK